MQRYRRILGHLTPEEPSTKPVTLNKTSGKSDDDVVIVSALRTAIARAGKGEFAGLYVEELLSPLFSATIERTGIPVEDIGDVVVGTVLGANGQRANEVRIAQFMGGIPNSVPVHTVNRQCSSGLQAIAECASAIKSGFYDVGLAAGVELMSIHKPKWEGKLNPEIFLNQEAKDCLLPMGITSENVAAAYNITREEQDQLAVRSHAKAAAATANNRFKDEIVPIRGRMKDRKTGKTTQPMVSRDGGIRKGTTMEGLSKLRTVFDKNGTTTAGNASQVSDGAATALVCSRKYAREHKLPVLGVFKSFAVAGVPPKVMGIGPLFAIPKALKKANLSISDIDLFEINEAFASQACYCVKELGIDMAKVNVNGGAIALGHPLGATGVRMTATLLHEMTKQNSRYGVVSMCIGTGMGAAAVFERDE